MPRSIFVNSSGWLALYNNSDPNHAAALALWEQLKSEPVRFVITDYVLDQVYTAFKMYGSVEVAKAFKEVWTNSEVVRFFMTDTVIFERAWLIFEEDEHPAWTFTDCVNYAVIQYVGISEVITFDPDFTAPDLTVLPARG